MTKMPRDFIFVYLGWSEFCVCVRTQSCSGCALSSVRVLVQIWCQAGLSLELLLLDSGLLENFAAQFLIHVFMLLLVSSFLIPLSGPDRISLQDLIRERYLHPGSVWDSRSLFLHLWHVLLLSLCVSRTARKTLNDRNTPSRPTHVGSKLTASAHAQRRTAWCAKAFWVQQILHPAIIDYMTHCSWLFTVVGNLFLNFILIEF